MSRDNAIVILETRDKDGRLEYRVCSVCQPEQFYGSERTEYVETCFGECRVFDNEANAVGEAFRLYEQQPSVQHGVLKVKLFGPYPGGDGFPAEHSCVLQPKLDGAAACHPDVPPPKRSNGTRRRRLSKTQRELDSLRRRVEELERILSSR